LYDRRPERFDVPDPGDGRARGPGRRWCTLGAFTLNASGTPTSWHFNILAAGAAIGRHTNAGARSFYHTDMLGSTRAVVNSSGTVTTDWRTLEVRSGGDPSWEAVPFAVDGGGWSDPDLVDTCETEERRCHMAGRRAPCPPEARPRMLDRFARAGAWGARQGARVVERG
jgi:hypothetical protein